MTAGTKHPSVYKEDIDLVKRSGGRVGLKMHSDYHEWRVID